MSGAAVAAAATHPHPHPLDPWVARVADVIAGALSALQPQPLPHELAVVCAAYAGPEPLTFAYDPDDRRPQLPPPTVEDGGRAIWLSHVRDVSGEYFETVPQTVCSTRPLRDAPARFALHFDWPNGLGADEPAAAAEGGVSVCIKVGAIAHPVVAYPFDGWPKHVAAGITLSCYLTAEAVAAAAAAATTGTAAPGAATAAAAAPRTQDVWVTDQSTGSKVGVKAVPIGAAGSKAVRWTLHVDTVARADALSFTIGGRSFTIPRTSAADGDAVPPSAPVSHPQRRAARAATAATAAAAFAADLRAGHLIVFAECDHVRVSAEAL